MSSHTRVALISPAAPDGNFTPPLGLLTLAAVLLANGHEVAVFDEMIHADAVAQALDYAPAVVGITGVTSSINRGLGIAARAKAALPGVAVVFGGPHPTALPEETLADPNVDFVVSGEGEAAMLGLAGWVAAHGFPYAADEALSAIPNLHYQQDGAARFTFRAPYLTAAELDLLPLPAYELLDIDASAEHFRHGVFRQGKRVLTYMASRGCPHKCAFCCRVMGSVVRRRLPRLVLDDLQTLVSRYRLDEIYFEDDNFTSNKAYAMEILDGIVERKLGVAIKFANGVRIDSLDDELLAAMRRAGCRALSFGLESGSRRTLEKMRKRLNLERVPAMVEKIRAHGFLVGANMIIGYPEETEADIEESYQFFRSLRLDSAAVVNLIPFPGTQVRDLCLEKGYLTPLAADWDNYYFDMRNPKILIETEQLPSEKLTSLMRSIFVRFYANPRRAWNLVRQLSLADLLAGAGIMLARIFGFKARKPQ